MTRPHPTLAEPPAVFTDALSGADGTADPVAAAPMADFFGDATADPATGGAWGSSRARAATPRQAPVGGSSAVGRTPVAVPAAASQSVPASQSAVASQSAAAAGPVAPAQPRAVPGIAPRRPAGVAPDRLARSTAGQPGRRMPQRYPAPQYPPSQYAASQRAATQWPPRHGPQGALPQGQWPPPAPPSVRGPQPAPMRQAGAVAPRTASYSPVRTAQPLARAAHPRPARPTDRSPRKSAGGWAVLLAMILFLVISGTGRELLDALAELLNR